MVEAKTKNIFKEIKTAAKKHVAACPPGANDFLLIEEVEGDDWIIRFSDDSNNEHPSICLKEEGEIYVKLESNKAKINTLEAIQIASNLTNEYGSQMAAEIIYERKVK